ncbi:hypothetical protein PR048_007289 [Dryococelus australis]|uniref:Uncharacterized protein n=1 Tax=Dryococelus australis TaxID=614101 RepID=A0ABQ9IEH8_9NEOP|nr:hypothetical protein PR048_007289 [Dryococelus australis]
MSPADSAGRSCNGTNESTCSRENETGIENCQRNDLVCRLEAAYRLPQNSALKQQPIRNVRDRFGRLLTVRFRDPMRVKRSEHAASPECKVGRNGISPSRPANQRHLTTPGIKAGSPRWDECSSRHTTAAPLRPSSLQHVADRLAHFQCTRIIVHPTNVTVRRNILGAELKHGLTIVGIDLDWTLRWCSLLTCVCCLKLTIIRDYFTVIMQPLFAFSALCTDKLCICSTLRMSTLVAHTALPLFFTVLILRVPRVADKLCICSTLRMSTLVAHTALPLFFTVLILRLSRVADKLCICSTLRMSTLVAHTALPLFFTVLILRVSRVADKLCICSTLRMSTLVAHTALPLFFTVLILRLSRVADKLCICSTLRMSTLVAHTALPLFFTVLILRVSRVADKLVPRVADKLCICCTLRMSTLVAHTALPLFFTVLILRVPRFADKLCICSTLRMSTLVAHTALPLFFTVLILRVSRVADNALGVFFVIRFHNGNDVWQSEIGIIYAQETKRALEVTGYLLALVDIKMCLPHYCNRAMTHDTFSSGERWSKLEMEQRRECESGDKRDHLEESRLPTPTFAELPSSRSQTIAASTFPALATVAYFLRARDFGHFHSMLSISRIRGDVVVRLLASHLGEPGSSHTWVFSGSLPPLHSSTSPYSPNFTLMGSQHFAVKSRPNLFTHSLAIHDSGSKWHTLVIAYDDARS